MSVSDEFRSRQLELYKAFESMEGESEKRIAKTYAKKLIEYKKYIAGLFEKHEDDGKLTYDEMIKYGRLGKMTESLKGITVNLYAENTKEISSTLKTVYTDAFNGTEKIISRAWGNKSLIGIINDEEIQRALTNEISGLSWAERMGINRDVAAAKIRETLVRGLYEGESYAQMAKRLDESLGKDTVGSLRIIRTESHRVFSEARKDRLDRVKGINMIKEWVTSMDELVRSNHKAMHGVKVPYNDNFLLPNGNSGFGPVMIGKPEDDINCRCFYVTDIAEADEEKGLYANYTAAEEIPEVYSEITNALDEESKEALKEYTGFPGSDMNIALREDNVPNRLQERIDKLDGILQAASLPENVILKRGTSPFAFEELKRYEYAKEIDAASLIGTRLTDKAFTSTGLLEPQSRGRDIILSIYTPQGTHGLYLNPVARPKFKNQYEVLLQRGCIFEVKRAKMEDEKLYLEVDIVND